MASDFVEAVKRLKAGHEERLRLMATDPEFRKVETARLASLEALERDQAAAEVKRRRASRGIPERAWAHLDALQETEAVREVRAFLVDPRLVLLFLGGGEGCGKTIAACSALDRRGGLFVKVGMLPRLRMDPIEWSRLVGAGAVVLDDLAAGYEDDKGFVVSSFYELIDLRYDALGKTIVTCNLTAARFRERYCGTDGGRLAGRIREAGRFVELDGASLRRAP